MDKNELEKRLYDADEKDFQRLDQAIQTNEKGFDHLILVTSTGVFAISISFITGFSDIEFKDPEVLICSWIIFALLIFIHSLGYFLGIRAAQASQDKDKSEMLRFKHYKNIPEVKNILCVIDILRTTTLVLLPIGMFALVLFAALNVL